VQRVPNCGSCPLGALLVLRRARFVCIGNIFILIETWAQNKIYILIDTLLTRLGSSVSIVSDYGLEDRTGFDPRQRQRIFPLASVSRPVLEPTQPPSQWVPGVLFPGLRGCRGVTLTIHPHLEPRSRMSRSYTFSPRAPP
jgi:hypothetical protein